MKQKLTILGFKRFLSNNHIHWFFLKNHYNSHRVTESYVGPFNRVEVSLSPHRVYFIRGEKMREFTHVEYVSIEVIDKNTALVDVVCEQM